MSEPASAAASAQPTGRLFAVIPAAGLSRRMGRPKLLLPVAGTTVIRRLLDVLDHPRITATVVVARRDDESLAAALAETGVRLVLPDVDPPDMRTSVERALSHIAERFAPQPDDGWLLIPADHPVLTRATLERLLERWTETTLGGSTDVLVPTFEGRRGHPALVRWSLTPRIAEIPPDKGLNHLFRSLGDRHRTLPVDDVGVVTDLDTPEDYARLLDRPEFSRE